MLAECEVGSAVRIEAGNQLGIIRGIGDDRHERVILRGRTDHRRAADVDIFDDLVSPGAFCDGLRKGVEVDHGKIDRANAVLDHRDGMIGIVADGEEAAVDHRVERLDPAVHHLGKAGQVGDVADAVAHGA